MYVSVYSLAVVFLFLFYMLFISIILAATVKLAAESLSPKCLLARFELERDVKPRSTNQRTRLGRNKFSHYRTNPVRPNRMNDGTKSRLR